MDHHDHDAGLSGDLAALLSRRRTVGLLAASGAASLIGCGRPPMMPHGEKDVTAVSADGIECVADPEETEGPFPADGSNRVHFTLANVLNQSGIVRRDMRSNLNGAGTAAAGRELRLRLKLVDAGASCAPLDGYAIYVWHCDAEGRYSIYQATEATYLRAVGVTGADGTVEFATIVPGCYDGRHPHIHFEVYPSLERATDYRTRLLTSQLVVPTALCREVYASTPSYARSVTPLEHSPLERDMIFADNTPKQLAAQTLTIAHDAGDGLQGTVTIGLKPRA